MLRIVSAIFCLGLITLPAFCQSGSKYVVGTITEVKVHQQAADNGTADNTSYDVSIRVGNTIYVALYTPPLGEITV